MPDDKLTPAEEEARRRRRSNYEQFYEAASLGLMFPLSIGIGFGIGWLLDEKAFHGSTWPWLTGVFTVFGIIAAFRNLFRVGAGGGNGDSGQSTPQS